MSAASSSSSSSCSRLCPVCDTADPSHFSAHEPFWCTACFAAEKEKRLDAIIKDGGGRIESILCTQFNADAGCANCQEANPLAVDEKSDGQPILCRVCKAAIASWDDIARETSSPARFRRPQRRNVNKNETKDEVDHEQDREGEQDSSSHSSSSSEEESEDSKEWHCPVCHTEDMDKFYPKKRTGGMCRECFNNKHFRNKKRKQTQQQDHQVQPSNRQRNNNRHFPTSGLAADPGNYLGRVLRNTYKQISVETTASTSTGTSTSWKTAGTLPLKQNHTSCGECGTSFVRIVDPSGDRSSYICTVCMWNLWATRQQPSIRTKLETVHSSEEDMFDYTLSSNEDSSSPDEPVSAISLKKTRTNQRATRGGRRLNKRKRSATISSQEDSDHEPQTNNNNKENLTKEDSPSERNDKRSVSPTSSDSSRSMADSSAELSDTSADEPVGSKNNAKTPTTAKGSTLTPTTPGTPNPSTSTPNDTTQRVPSTPTRDRQPEEPKVTTELKSPTSKPASALQHIPAAVAKTPQRTVTIKDEPVTPSTDTSPPKKQHSGRKVVASADEKWGPCPICGETEPRKFYPSRMKERCRSCARKYGKNPPPVRRDGEPKPKPKAAKQQPKPKDDQKIVSRADEPLRRKVVQRTNRRKSGWADELIRNLVYDPPQELLKCENCGEEQPVADAFYPTIQWACKKCCEVTVEQRVELRRQQSKEEKTTSSCSSISTQETPPSAITPTSSAGSIRAAHFSSKQCALQCAECGTQNKSHFDKHIVKGVKELAYGKEKHETLCKLCCFVDMRVRRYKRENVWADDEAFKKRRAMNHCNGVA